MDSIDINKLALEQDAREEEWQDLLATCYNLRMDPDTVVRITSYTPTPKLHRPSGQLVRSIRGTLNNSEEGHAKLLFHVGVLDETVFTGYDDEGFQDFIDLTSPTGRVFEGSVPRPGLDDPDPGAWRTVLPVLHALYDAYVVRLIEGRPIVDQSPEQNLPPAPIAQGDRGLILPCKTGPDATVNL